jgi:hypothetical protein
MERSSSSHKIDGRHSSAGQSVHSTHSTPSIRGHNFGLDSAFGAGHLASSLTSDAGKNQPGMALLGPVPAIVRCWLDDEKFSHDTLVYAAVCTGSYSSYLGLRLARRLGLVDASGKTEHGQDKIRLSVYLAEASVLSSPRSDTFRVPAMTVDFSVVDQRATAGDKLIEVFLGSLDLRAHNADILFSQNIMTLVGEDDKKLSVPLVRPEDEHLFKHLYTASAATPRSNAAHDTVTALGLKDAKSLASPTLDKFAAAAGQAKTGIATDTKPQRDNDVDEPVRGDGQLADPVAPAGTPAGRSALMLNGAGPANPSAAAAASYRGSAPGNSEPRRPRSQGVSGRGGGHGGEDGKRSGASAAERGTDTEPATHRGGSGGSGGSNSGGSTSGIWGPWRREASQRLDGSGGSGSGSSGGGGGGGSGSGSSGNGNGSGYHRSGRSRGAKVLRPSKSSASASRQTSASQTTAGAAVAVGAEAASTPNRVAATSGGGGGNANNHYNTNSVGSNSINGYDGAPSSSGKTGDGPASSRRSGSGDVRSGSMSTTSTTTTASVTTATPATPAAGRLENPVGGASAFAWLNGNQQK